MSNPNLAVVSICMCVGGREETHRSTMDTVSQEIQRQRPRTPHRDGIQECPNQVVRKDRNTPTSFPTLPASSVMSFRGAEGSEVKRVGFQIIRLATNIISTSRNRERGLT